jgi:phosphate-selective porin
MQMDESLNFLKLFNNMQRITIKIRMQKFDTGQMKKIGALLVALIWLTTLEAQNIFASLNDTATISKFEAPSAAAPVMAKKWNQIHTKWFNLNFGAAFILDHNILSQNAENIQQVGKVDPGTEFRGERLMVSGNILLFKNPWRYMVSANFNGLDAEPGSKKFDFIDWNLEIPFNGNAGWLTLGKQKEGVGMEYVAPGTQLGFMERGSGVPMFVRQRNIGIRYSNSVLNNRLAYTVGVFNNYWETGKSFSANGSQYTFRITGLPQYVSDRNLMHIGFGFRHTDATDGKLSYKAKPEANTAPSFISTGSFDADAANTLMFEWVKVNGPVMVVAEYMNTAVKSVSKGNPRFDYFQLGGSWFLTGENRRYNKQNGNLGKLMPKKNFKFRKGTGPGAFELGARYTYASADDALVSGGVFKRFTTALSWYPNAHFRYEINYGYGGLNKNNLLGNSSFWQFRIQFEL